MIWKTRLKRWAPVASRFSVASCCRTVFPALATGFTLAFARAVGEYGSVIFIAGNLPMRTEITPLLIVIKLEQFDYKGAAALGFVMLTMSFVMLLVHQPAASLEPSAHGRRGTLMAGGPSKEMLAEIASRPGRDTLVSSVVKYVFILLSLGFLAALLFAPLATVFITALEQGLADVLRELQATRTRSPRSG